MKRIFIRRTAVMEAVVFLLVIVLPILAEKSQAANLQRTIVRLDRMAISQPTTGEVCIQPQTTSATNVDVQVTFPTGFTVSGTAGNWTTSTAGILNGSTVWPGVVAATPTISGQTVTWTYGSSQTLTAGTLYCFLWTNTAAVSTPGSASANLVGSVTTRTTAAATIDSGSYATAIVGTNADQIAVSATVPSTFSFALNLNTDSIGTLSTSTASSTGRTVTIGTNASAGWVAWVKSANTALSSVSTGATVATAGSVDNTPTDLSATTGYVLDVDITTDSGTGTGTVTQAANFGAEYAGANVTSGGTLSTTFQPIAASDGTTDADVLTLTERAKITAVQAAASDYADTLTVVAAGRF